MNEPTTPEQRNNHVHHDLKAVKTSSFRGLDLVAEAFDEILIDDPVRRSKKSKNITDEVTLVTG